jgi:hypothetical protein
MRTLSREDIHCMAMRTQAAVGNRVAVKEQYETLRGLLQKEPGSGGGACNANTEGLSRPGRQLIALVRAAGLRPQAESGTYTLRLSL